MNNYLFDFHCNLPDIKDVRVRLNGREYTLCPVTDQTTDALESPTFGEFTNQQISLLREEKHLRTAETYHCATKRFLNYLGHDIALCKIDRQLIQSYERFLRAEGLISNSSSFHMRVLRAIYNKAVKNHIISDNIPFCDVYTGIGKTIKRALPIDIIHRIAQLNNLNCHEIFARDMFLFSFYTRGMSFIDMSFLKTQQIRNGYLLYTRHKTGQQLVIKWESCMQDIVNRYNTSTPYLLPIIKRCNGNERSQYREAQRKVNGTLKSIGQKAGITIPLSMYVARHSWASIARNMDVPLSIISEGMGHTSEHTTRIYLKSLSTRRLDSISAAIIQAVKQD